MRLLLALLLLLVLIAPIVSSEELLAKKMADKLNARLPQRVGTNMVWVSVQFPVPELDPRALMYSYLMETSWSSIPAEELGTKTRDYPAEYLAPPSSALSLNVCSDPANRELFDSGIRYVFRYVFPNNECVLYTLVGPKQCDQ